MNVEPVKLAGHRVVLEPLSRVHFSELAAAGMDPSLWEYTVDRIEHLNDIESYLEKALADAAAGISLPFVTKVTDSDKIVGSTRFGNISIRDRKVEIGWTWIVPEFQRTFVNAEAKLLMLTHAFETWKCIRVEFKTDATNVRSRMAIGRLGAKEEGVLRNHMITESGRFRDSVYFSILDTEWDGVKTILQERLKKYQ